MMKGLRTTFYTICAVLMIGVHSCQPARERLAMETPEENRFTTSTISLPGSLDEPMAFTFLNEDEMLIVERKGG